MIINLCPFDGEEPKQIVKIFGPGIGIDLFIRCEKCGVQMSKALEFNQEYELKDILKGFDELAEQWNRRVK